MEMNGQNIRNIHQRLKLGRELEVMLGLRPLEKGIDV